MKNSEWAYGYASDIIKDRWSEAEPYIMKNSYWADLYNKFIDSLKRK